AGATPRVATATTTTTTVPFAGIAEADRVSPRALSVSGLSVWFGGVCALDNLSMEVQPGEVVGLIGPNGAGKSTAIEAITGFVRPRHGTVSIGATVVDRMSRERRARAGISRSFQSLELF